MVSFTGGFRSQPSPLVIDFSMYLLIFIHPSIHPSQVTRCRLYPAETCGQSVHAILLKHPINHSCASWMFHTKYNVDPAAQ